MIAETVLIVDDDPVFRATLAASLARRQWRVTTAGTSAEALRLIHTEQPGRIVLDLNLAGHSGLKLLSEILAGNPNRRVVLLTAYPSIASAVEAIKRGACNYLCKPVTASDLLAAFQDESDLSEEVAEAEGEGPLPMERLEWEHIQKVLQDHDGNISATARALRMHRRTLQRKLQRPPR